VLTETIEIQGIEPVILLGPHDRYLKQIKKEFPDITINSRGSEITMEGKADEIRLLVKVLSEMMLMATRDGEISEHDFKTIVNLAISPVPKENNEGIPLDDDVIVASKDYVVRAKTNGQRRMVAEAKTNDILFAIGPAGTGKTYTAVAIAVAAWKAKTVKRIVLARPVRRGGRKP